MNEACSFYNEVAKQSNKEVFAKVYRELQEQLLTQLYHCFDSQLKMIRQYTYDKVVTEIRKLQTKPLEEVADQLDAILKALVE